MCLGTNDDKLQGRKMSESSSNRNVIGRQGSPTGRTLLMSPAMGAAAAITGAVADVKAVSLARQDTVTVDVEKHRRSASVTASSRRPGPMAQQRPSSTCSRAGAEGR